MFRVREALAYADMGYPVLPIGLDEVSVFSPYAATTDAETLVRYARQLPGANIGIALDGLLLVDADTPEHAPDGNGPDGVATWCGYGFDVGQPVIITPTGGMNSLYRLPRGVKVKNGAGVIAPGIDIVTGPGRFALVPASETKRGPYTWGRMLTDIIPFAPSELLRLIRERKRAKSHTGIVTVMPTLTAEGALERLHKATEGARNTELNNAAYAIGRLVAAGRVTENEAYDLLYTAGRALGLGDKESEKTALSGLRAGKAATGDMPVTEYQEHAYTQLAWAQGRGWPGRTGTNDYKLTIAHILIALRAGRETYDASVRELAELAGLGHASTASRANARLAAQNVIRVITPGKPYGFRPGEYALVRHNATYTQNSGGTGVGKEYSPASPLLGVCCTLTQGHDVWRYRGLGATAGVVWETLRRDGPATVAELIQRTGKKRRTIERAVNKLARVVDVATGEVAALVEKDGVTYTALAVGLDDIARLLHVDGQGAAQRARHERERERHVRSWEIERMRRYLGNLPVKEPSKARKAQRKAHERVGAIRGVKEHGADTPARTE